MPKGRPKKPIAQPMRHVKTPQLLRGFKDILPQEEKYWNFLEDKVKTTAEENGFQKIEIPILEESALFTHAIGRETDIVSKELFSFVLKDGAPVSLRPEGTASVVRAYINHGMWNLPQPIKLWYIGPMFRYDRPQAGRFRQFHQFGFEILGSDHPILDADLIATCANFLKSLGVSFKVLINSIGCMTCRPAYISELIAFLRSRRKNLCSDCRLRTRKNVLRILDCKEKKCQTIFEDAPKIIDHLCEDCKKHFTRVLEYLEEMEIEFSLEPNLVRGLDYYTKTVFEIIPLGGAIPEGTDSSQRQDSIAAGGRYDRLAEMLGGRPTPGLGVAFGCERLLNVIRAKLDEMALDVSHQNVVFLAQLGEKARRKILRLREELRKQGIKTIDAFYKDGLRAQLEIASKLKVRLALILGEKEIIDGTIILRDMDEGIQEIIPFERVVETLKGKLTI